MGAKIFPMPGVFDHKSDEFGACDFCRLGIIEDRVMIPLMAARGHVHSRHAERDLVLGFIKALSEEVMRFASSGIEDAQFPEAPLAHTAIAFKGDESVLLVTHDSIIAQMGTIRAIINRGLTGSVKSGKMCVKCLSPTMSKGNKAAGIQVVNAGGISGAVTPLAMPL